MSRATPPTLAVRREPSGVNLLFRYRMTRALAIYFAHTVLPTFRPTRLLGLLRVSNGRFERFVVE